MPKDLFKVNSEQIFFLWRNFAISVLTIILTHFLTRLLPVYMAPIISTVGAAAIYFVVYNNYYSNSESCVIVPYTVFLILVVYTITLVSLNLLNIWTVISIPAEMNFFSGYYIPNLLLAPIGLVTCLFIYWRRHKISICANCKLTNGTPLDRGRVGIIYSSESELQLRNLIYIYILLTSLAWGYYLFAYIDVNFSKRDVYVFTWLAIATYICDIIYFGICYYNLFLDLKENDELIYPEDITDSGVRTYARFYVICSDNMYMSHHSPDGLRDDDSNIMDSPFLIKRNMNGIPEIELKAIISRMTGVSDGTLRFFYGRKTADASGRRLLRYFYFLPGDVEEYPELAVPGEWLSSEKLKTLYNKEPDRLSSTCLADISRLATILITQKTFTDEGERRVKIMHYHPSFNLQELQESETDFQDDKWIRISMFNADTKFFRLRKWWRSKWRNTPNTNRL